VRSVAPPAQSNHVNMADVAHRAGVSTATVSRALRDMPGVSPRTRARIKEIAEELSYVISPEASRLSGGSTGRVAVVMPRINVWYFSTMLAGIESVLRDADLDVLIYHVGGAEDRRRFFERLPARRKADAVVVIALPMPEEQAARLDRMGVEVVVAGARVGPYPHVRVDDVLVARQAVDHLLALGHERIAMIRTADPEGAVWAADADRCEGYRQALRAAGIEPDDQYVATVPYSNDGGAQGMARMMSLRRPPTAVFAHSDEIAMAALRTLRRAHVPVPEGMSIVGVDDHPMAELHDLTTVHQPVEEQGRLTAHMVLDLVAGRPLPSTEVTVPTYLVVRSSTAPPPDLGAAPPDPAGAPPRLTRRRRAPAPRPR
jgi:LacI family repressor for deo operon, udp, cdd, tsx, nupC, and nupG